MGECKRILQKSGIRQVKETRDHSKPSADERWLRKLKKKITHERISTECLLSSKGREEQRKKLHRHSGPSTEYQAMALFTGVCRWPEKDPGVSGTGTCWCLRVGKKICN